VSLQVSSVKLDISDHTVPEYDCVDRQVSSVQLDISDRTVPEHDCVGHQVSLVQFPYVCRNAFRNILTEKSCSDWNFMVEIIV
jgi:hypothetical protein